MPDFRLQACHSILLVSLFFSITAYCTPAQAESDCRTTYSQATSLLDSTTQKANNNEHPDQENFDKNFQQLVDKMQTNKCLPELMSLIQHIQTQQQKYPAVEPAKPLPITD